MRSGYSASLPGNFDGNASNTSINLNDTPAIIVAESPDAVYAEITGDLSGPHEITVTENGESVTETIDVIDLDLTVDKFDLVKGESTTLHLKVSGIKDLEGPVAVKMENRTPQNVNLEGGTIQEINISTADVATDGTYRRDFGLTANRAGGFNISGVLNPPPPAESLKDEPDPETTPADSLPGLSDPNPIKAPIPTTRSEYNMDPDGFLNLINYNVDPNADVDFTVVVPEEEVQEERNKARNIPGDTPLAPRDPDDRDKPYSRPVPTGIKADKEHKGTTWKDADKMLDRAKSQVTKAQGHKGPITFGTPGRGTISTSTPSKSSSSTTGTGVTCTEQVYRMSVNYFYIADRTLLHEEQLSPSKEFIVAEGESKIDVTETESGWEVEAKASASKGPFEVEVRGKYWEKTTKIKGKGSSKLKGRTLWLFHVGRLYLVRRAFLRIDYEYHYVTCSNGTSRNWVNITYSDNWAYWYEWQEELFVAFKDDEGNFHREDSFPETSNTDTGGAASESYEVNSLDKGNFSNPKSSGFYPNK